MRKGSNAPTAVLMCNIKRKLLHSICRTWEQPKRHTLIHTRRIIGWVIDREDIGIAFVRTSCVEALRGWGWCVDDIERPANISSGIVFLCRVRWK
jgi:hypothetical protein